MPRNTTDYGDLTALSGRLDRWRRRHGGRGRRIPAELWQEAAHAALGLGADTVARALRVRQERLEDLLEGGLESEAVELHDAAEFVEVHLPATTFSSSSSVGRRCGPAILVQLEAPDGRRLRLEVPRGVSCDVGAVFAAFRGDAS